MQTHWARRPETQQRRQEDRTAGEEEAGTARAQRHRRSALREGRCHHSEAGNTQGPLIWGGDTPAHSLHTRSIRCRQYPPASTPQGLGTHLKNRGWCSTLFSSKTRRLSLCSCSILCFCTSASSTFPSSRNLRRGGRNKGTQLHGNVATLLLKLQVSTLDIPHTLLYKGPSLLK